MLSINKNKVLLRIAVIITLLLGCIVILFIIGKDFNSEEVTANAIFIFAGTINDADCSIFLGNCCIVVDTGEKCDSDHIITLLNDHNVSNIDCLILSHPDKDHIGGAAALLENFTVSKIILPYYNQNNPDYNDLMELINTNNISTDIFSGSRAYVYGYYSLTVYAPENLFYDDDNNYSLAVLISHGDNNIFLPGDAKKERLEELNSIIFPEISLLKIPYHGRSSNASSEFIENLCPSIAIVNSSSPESKIKKVLNKINCEYYTTVGYDRTFISDGNTLKIISSPI